MDRPLVLYPSKFSVQESRPANQHRIRCIRRVAPTIYEIDCNKVNMMVKNLMPQAGETELLAKILANAFGAGFESYQNWKRSGLI